ncbi:MAG: SH3 domain-containing protein [Phascolarctobacterium sp.]
MRLKSLTLGLALALLISAPLTTEASVYEKEASMEFNIIDTQIGKTVDFVELQNHYIVKRDLAFVCARDYVKPCFSKKGITLSDVEAQAVAFGAMQLENGKHTSTSDDEYAYKAKGVIYEDWELAGVYENKKFMQAYVALQKEISAIYDAYAAVVDFYYDNKNSPRIDAKTLETLKEMNIKLTSVYRTLENMELFWQHGRKFVLTGDDVNFRSAPSTNSEVLDSLRLNEELYPMTGEVLEIEGRRWVQAINAKGQEGYVSADYVQLTD